MEAKNTKKVELGLKLVGVVMAKNTYVNKNTGETKHQVDVACPGNRENITLGVTPEEFNNYTELDKFDQRISVMNVNGRILFNILGA